MPAALSGAVSTQLLADLGIGHSVFGLAIAGFFLSNAVFSPFAGGLADRLGAIASIRIGAAITSLSMLAIATLAVNHIVFLALMIVAGPAIAIGGPGASMLLTRMKPSRQPFLFGLRQAFIPMAALIAGISVSISAGQLGWRWAFAVAAILTALLTLPWRDRGRQQAEPVVPAAPAAVWPPRPAPQYSTATLWLLALVFGLAGFAATSFTSFITGYAQSVGHAPASAGLILAIGSGTAVTVRIIVGFWVGRSALHPLDVALVMLAAGSIGCAIVAFAGPGALAPGLALAYGGAWGWTGLLIYTITTGSRGRPGRANGIVQAGGGIGGVGGPLVVGPLIEHVSYQAAWSMTLVSVVAAAVLLASVRMAASWHARRNPA